jgi:hypothetical protein
MLPRHTKHISSHSKIIFGHIKRFNIHGRRLPRHGLKLPRYVNMRRLSGQIHVSVEKLEGDTQMMTGQTRKVLIMNMYG